MGWNVNELECESAGMETGNGNQNKLFTLVVEIRIGMGWNSIDNLSSEELDLEIGEEALLIRDESRGGDLPCGVGPLKLNEPLIRCHTGA
ncbi:hypothetical protein WN943_024880 [Citrus x changshan-huyou]